MEPSNINKLGLSALLAFCVRFKVTQTGPSWGLPSKAETLFDTKTQRLRSSKFELGTKGSLLPSEDGLTFTIWGLKIPWNSTPKLKNATLQFCTGCASLTAVREWVCWRAFIPFLAFPSDLWTCGTSLPHVVLARTLLDSAWTPPWDFEEGYYFKQVLLRKGHDCGSGVYFA